MMFLMQLENFEVAGGIGERYPPVAVTCSRCGQEVVTGKPIPIATSEMIRHECPGELIRMARS